MDHVTLRPSSVEVATMTATLSLLSEGSAPTADTRYGCHLSRLKSQHRETFLDLDRAWPSICIVHGSHTRETEDAEEHLYY